MPEALCSGSSTCVILVLQFSLFSLKHLTVYFNGEEKETSGWVYISTLQRPHQSILVETPA